MTNQTRRLREPQSGVAIQSFSGLLRFARKDDLCKALPDKGKQLGKRLIAPRQLFIRQTKRWHTGPTPSGW